LSDEEYPLTLKPLVELMDAVRQKGRVLVPPDLLATYPQADLESLDDDLVHQVMADLFAVFLPGQSLDIQRLPGLLTVIVDALGFHFEDVNARPFNNALYWIYGLVYGVRSVCAAVPCPSYLTTRVYREFLMELVDTWVEVC